jgi:hypothetical protein
MNLIIHDIIVVPNNSWHPQQLGEPFRHLRARYVNDHRNAPNGQKAQILSPMKVTNLPRTMQANQH